MPPLKSEISSSEKPPLDPSGGGAAGRKPDFIPSALTGWIGLAGFIAGVVWLNKVGPVYQLHRYWEGLILMVFTSVPMVIWDAIVLRRQGAGRPVDGITRQHAYSFERTALKLVGLAGSVCLLGVLYWVFPEYNPSLLPDGGFYSNFFSLCREAGPWVLAVCAGYFYFVDARLEDPQDGYWHFGRVVLLDLQGIDWAKVRNHLRTWAVKGFFLPLMFTFLCNNLPGLHWREVHSAGVAELFGSGGNNIAVLGELFHWTHNLLFSIDLAFVSCGYVLTLRWVQSHVRSAEPTALGWTAALMCYLPFWKMIGDLYLGYWSDGNWMSKLAQNQGLLFACAAGILFFEVVFVWATISFGLRFSNLTHRGIVTKGPYYFTKHPAYIAKICAFFLLALPWIDSRGGAQGVRNLLMLAGLALLYWIRAKTEERHLASIDPAYALYAAEVGARHRRWLRLQFGARS